MLVADCPRCGAAKMTFSIEGDNTKNDPNINRGRKGKCEVFSICRNCHKGTIFILEIYRSLPEQLELSAALSLTSKEDYSNRGPVTIAEFNSKRIPEYLEGVIATAFEEAVKCMAINCPNAAGVMFRLCLDVVTKPLLPKENTEELNETKRRNLGPRLTWLFKNNRLPEDLKGLARCVREDGNDGAHEGTLTQDDAEDLYDFTYAILERLVTTPAKVKAAEEKRTQRRSGGSSQAPAKKQP